MADDSGRRRGHTTLVGISCVIITLVASPQRWKERSIPILATPPNPSNLNTNPSPPNPKPHSASTSTVKVHRGRVSPHVIPDWILNHPAVREAKKKLPYGYEFEIEKTAWTLYRKRAKSIALQFPEGLLKCANAISDALVAVANVTTVTLADVVYGACCLDDHRAKALGCDMMVHYGHSCLIPNDCAKLPTLYVFVTLPLDLNALVDAVNTTLLLNQEKIVRIALMGTIQFAPGIAKARNRFLSQFKDRVTIVVPRALPLAPGETLGCTSPRVPKDVDVVVFISDGVFHLESAMLQNRHVPVFYRFDPYTKSLICSKYPSRRIVSGRIQVISQAKTARVWGLIHGTLGRQGNPAIVHRIETLIREKGFSYVKVPVPEITPELLAAFPQVEAWIQVACPRLSIDWGKEFSSKPLLTPFEAFSALEAKEADRSGENDGGPELIYPMDFYAEGGGEWSNYYRPKN
ncbi:hypothetical protein AAMO2058_001662400 [Amorphochlora amoebiformis]